MSKTLYLCEKPDQGRAVAKALGGGSNIDGGIEGSNWIVTWCIGHLLSPYMPDDYNPELKKWSWEGLPIVPEKFLFKPSDSGRAKQLAKIRALSKKASRIVVSTDPDREGEMIAYSVLNEIKWTGGIERLWLSDMNLPAIQKSLKELRPGEDTKPLYWAALARTYADWLVGMNISRAATLKLAAYGAKPMSVGRVQTPVLAMVVDLERKITNFKPVDYFEITTDVSTDKGALKMRYAPSGEERLLDRAKAEALRAAIQGAKGPMTAKTEAKREGPPPLFSLAKLQQACNKKFGWSADKTLGLVQKLYENQFLTYPRSDCAVLPEAHKDDFNLIKGNLMSLPQFSRFQDALASPEMRKSVYNDAKLESHHAIVPTHKAPDFGQMSADEQKVYDLVARHWMAAHFPDMEYLQTTITMPAASVVLRASGRQIVKEGWRVVFSTVAADDREEDEEESDSDQILPPVKTGDIGTVTKAVLDSKKTKPPARFNEATLLLAMENIASFVTDPVAKKTLKDTSGIGTSATRASIIETLKSRGYIIIKKRQISPTEIAFTLIDSLRKVAPNYADPVMTARWEDVLDEISKGRNIVKAFVQGIADAIRKDVVALHESDLQKMGGGTRKGPDESAPGYIAGDWKKAITEGTPIEVPFEKKDNAQKLGARWDKDRKTMVIPKGVDPAPIYAAGFKKK